MKALCLLCRKLDSFQLTCCIVVFHCRKYQCHCLLCLLREKIYKKPLGNDWIDFISTVRCSLPHPTQIPSQSTIHIAPVCHIHPKICYIDNFTRSMCRGAVVLYQDVTTWGFTLQKLGNPKAKTTSHPLCLLLTRTRAEMRASDHRIT